VVEVLKQPQYDPQPVERQVVAIYTVTGGYLDDYPVEDAKRFVTSFNDYLETRHAAIPSAIRESGDLSDETEAGLKAAIGEFASTFVPTSAAAGSESGIGATSPPDEVKPDIGWDRMSSVDDEPPTDPETPASA
jgi:F-type H+-transporting ATPase subunit alpha